MPKEFHEIRDPIQNFIRIDSDERKVLNSWPFQRLRYIHQLAMTYLVYPGATHSRFEHSLGVMELASRVYDIITREENLRDEVRDLFPEIGNKDKRSYWKRVLRMAALCHDLGHLPFSHAAEKDLLPEGWDHERLTAEIIRSDEMRTIWDSMSPPLRVEDIIKLAIGPKKLPDVHFTDWEAILSEIIVGDAFGVDRIDYLLRDSLHSGVGYGRFDHYRLVDTLRILPRSYVASREPALGVEEGGLHAAESLLLARYFMYTQVYFHPIRRIYDIHLKDFLKAWLRNSHFSIQVPDYLQITDSNVIVAMIEAAADIKNPGHDPAKRILKREHFRLIYQRNPVDLKKTPNAGLAIFQAACKEFGQKNVRHDAYLQKGGLPDFPVLDRDGRINSSLEVSEALGVIPVVAIDFIFVAPEYQKEAIKWLKDKREKILKGEE